MGGAGRLPSASGAAVSDHACWGYASGAERAEAATAWLRDAFALGQRAMYVADLSPDELLADLAGLPDRDDAVARGALAVVPSSALYDLSHLIDPVAQLAVYAGAVEEALADGYTGVRVVADITPLVADPARRPSHSHWEQYADRYIAEHPLAPLCLYDTRRIDDIDAIISVHALQGPDPAPFSVYAEDARGARVSGEIDATGAHTFAAVLAGLPSTDRTLDLTGLEFVDARAAWVLQREVLERRQREQDLTVVGASPIARRVWTLGDLDDSVLDEA